MSGQHTPGPWLFEPHGAYKSDLLGEDWPVGYISTAHPPVPIFVLGEILERPVDEVVANARLMAAAPELLAALEIALEVLDMEGVCGAMCTACATARAVIAKASGIETGTAKTEGLGPKDESPTPKGDAQS